MAWGHQVTSHYQNQWWSSSRRPLAPLGHSELNNHNTIHLQGEVLMSIFSCYHIHSFVNYFNFNNCIQQTRDIFEKCTLHILISILIINCSPLLQHYKSVPALSDSLIFISVCMCINVEFHPYTESWASATIRSHSWWSSTNIYGTQFCLLSFCLSFGSCLSFDMCHQIKHHICCKISQNYNWNVWVYFNRSCWNLPCTSTAELQMCMANFSRTYQTK